jgi:hypothetical protein
MKRILQIFISAALFMFLVPVPRTAHLSPFMFAVVILAVVLVASSYPVKKTKGVRYAGVDMEIWVNYIMERFWKDNNFLKFAFNEDVYVVGGKYVHIPQPGSMPNIVKNRATFPAAAVRRTDTDILYALDEYTTDPTHIEDAEKVQLSYDKIDSVIGDHLNSLNQTVADDILTKWLTGIPGTAIVRTGGASAASAVAGQTGNRLAMVHTDLRKCQLALNLQNAPDTERYTLLEANMADQLFDSLSNTQYRDFSQYADAANGVIGKLYGFNIMVRSNVVMASNADAVNPLGAATLATDNTVSICWQKNAVTRALGEVKFFEDVNRPEYYGDLYSALLRSGARRRRGDDTGVIALVQSVAS